MRLAPFQPVPRLAVTVYPAGQAADVWRPGDFVLTHGDAFISRVIRWGESLRIHGADRKYTWCNHAVLIVDEHGTIAEAQANGIVEANMSKYRGTEYAVVSASDEAVDRQEVVDFANWALKTRHSYGWLAIVSVFFSSVTGCKFTFFIDGTFTCSGFVATALQRTSAIFNLDPVHITPADLAKYYSVDPPQSA